MSWRMWSSRSDNRGGECALSRQRRNKPMTRQKLYCGKTAASRRVSFAVTLVARLLCGLRRGGNGSVSCSLQRQKLFNFCSPARSDACLRLKSNQIGHDEDLPSVALAVDFAQPSSAVRSPSTTRPRRNMGTASYATISGSGNSATFETGCPRFRDAAREVVRP